ncbi:PARP-type zinc finger-containing protein [Lachnellula occidentalis]|uniref:PARP-type zinc finger-containing protein n=1 Tax=Lachnellula occidentalis TaxID=215460 RepID=A0A8H8UJ67_9HELO|nr:PARP-type zinc finger-containing protein [Lachnellula occidentalis]
MSYRVETASTGRATCVATECKKAGIKIDKDDLRFGVWVEIKGNGSFRWKHWGCVTGAQIQNMRENLEDPESPGTYRWDYLDGYDSGEKNSIDRFPDLQEKVRRVITQGFIDPEDFNGDPEMNVLGEKGLRTPASKAKARAEQKKAKEDAADESPEAEQAPKKAASKKRAEGNDESDAEEKPAKKKRITKAKKEEDSEEEVKPIKKSRAKKVKKDEDSDEEAKPVKSRAKKVKKEEDSDEEVKPVKKSRAKVVKKEEDEEARVHSFHNLEDEISKPAPPAKKPRAKKVKNEDDSDTPAVPALKKSAPRGKKAVKDEEVDEHTEEAVEPFKAKAPAKKGRKKVVKDEPSEDVAMTGVESSAVAEGSTLPTELDSSHGAKGENSDVVDLPSAAPAVDDIDTQIATLKKLKFNDSLLSSGRELGPDDETMIPGIKDFDLRAMFAASVNEGEIEDDQIFAFLEKKRDEMIAELESKTSKPKKGGRGKKATAASSTGTSRKRTASKA